MHKNIEKEETIDKDRKMKKELFELKEVVGIVIITAIIGFLIGFSVKQKNTEISLSRYEEELISNYKRISTNYYKNIDARDLVSAAIKGMIDYLDDPYADYINASNIDNFNMIINGEYEGVGIQISYNDNYEPIITYVFPNSSADIGGLRENDIIVSIEDTNVSNKTLEEVKEIVSNFDDKEFKITYKRDGNFNETKLRRTKVTIESVTIKEIDKNNQKIGYLKLSNFASNSYEQFKEKLLELEKNGIDSLIIDLRDNTGGQLTTVDNIVSLFVEQETVIYQMKEKDKITKYYSHGDTTREYKIVVLVNERSASASELMTGALKEMYGATIIGTNTYGKGTAQEVVTLDNGEQYKFTTKEWLTAKGNSIEGIGIEPTINVDQSEEYYNNPTDENDKQLIEAIEYLCK